MLSGKKTLSWNGLSLHYPEAATVFSKDSSAERERLELLREIYISYRYYINVVIHEDDIDYLFSELNKLQEMGGSIDGSASKQKSRIKSGISY